MAKALPNALSQLNIVQWEAGAFAALLGEAHQYLVTGILMRLGFLVSVITVRGGTYDLIIPAYEDFTSNKQNLVLLKAQVRTVRQSLSFLGGLRAGKGMVSFYRGYKYTTQHNDLIIGVDQATLDLYLVPTRYIGRWGNSASKGKLQVLKNNFEILLNWNEEFLAELERRL